MAFKSLATSGIVNSAKYQNALVGNAAFDPASDFLIQEQVLTSTATSVTFSSIPQTYKHLQIRMVSRVDTYSNAALRFNADSGTNYANHYLRANGSAVASSATTGASSLVFGETTTSGDVSGNFAPFIIDILDYASSSKNKVTKTLSGNSPSFVQMRSGLWLSTAAITQVTILGNPNWQIGSRFSLYGSLG